MDNILLTLIRLIIPLTIFKWPLPGIIIASLIDLSDWHWYTFTQEQDYVNYSFWDKWLDTYYLAIAAGTSLFWKDIKAQKVAIYLFIWRVAGVALFTFSANSVFLFLAPNVFEVFFIFYLTYRLIAKSDFLFAPKEKGIVLMAIIAAPKIMQEYLMHIQKINPPELLSAFGFFAQMDLSFWIMLVGAIAFYISVLFWRIKST